MRAVLLTCVAMVAAIAGQPAAASAAETPLDAAARLTNTTVVINSIKQIPELAAYLNNPKVACTGFLPTNEGAAAAMKELGRYIGLFATDEKLQTEIMNYHIIPGKRLTPEQLKDGLVLESRNNKDPLKIRREGDKIQVMSTPDFVANLTTGKPIETPTCLVYTIDFILAPPNRAPSILEYTAKAQADKAAAEAADGATTPSSPAAAGGVALPAASPAPAPRSGAAAVAPAATGIIALLAAGAGWGFMML